MTNEEQLVEAHVMEYESRLKHIDELIERASNMIIQEEDAQAELSRLKQKRENLAGYLDQITGMSDEEWAKEGGPMVLWDVVAGRLERLIEYLGSPQVVSHE